MIKTLIIVNLIIAIIDYVMCFLAARVAREKFFEDYPNAELKPKSFNTRFAEHTRAIITCFMPIVNIFVLFGVVVGWNTAIENTYEYLIERKKIVPKKTHTNI